MLFCLSMVQRVPIPCLLQGICWMLTSTLTLQIRVIIDKLCISRQMYTAVQASNRKKHMPLNSYISLYASNENENGENFGEEFINFLGFEPVKNPEQLLIDKENVISLERKIEEELSTFENQVLDLYLTGMSYSQIARVLGRDEKSTDNALQRIKNKIRKVIAE